MLQELLKMKFPFTILRLARATAVDRSDRALPGTFADNKVS